MSDNASAGTDLLLLKAFLKVGEVLHLMTFIRILLA